MAQRKDKKLVSVSYDLVEEITKAARRRGETITKFLEEALTQAVKVTSAGYDLKQLGQFFEVMYAQKILGGAFVPLDVLNFLTATSCKTDRENVANVWFESGKWHGKYLKERFYDPVKALEDFLEASRWDLNEIEVKRFGATARVRCVSTVLSDDATRLLAKFIEGIMQGFGYKLQKCELLKGMIVQEFLDE
ncbi:MAG: hypothetical protein FWF66_05620 [Candidatus Bathyarchaeota archaeon]|nr:hypothetical protein [Candidatus Termiticorpusculum sp.]MCL1970916.1 hypothetical protein [Candidatus Termiticorpusculum sp.]